MVADTVAFLVGHGRRVFLDCEHFFDGYAHDPDYGVRVLRGRVRRRRRGRRHVRHQRRHAADGRGPGRRRRPRPGRAAGSASTARTTPAARSPTPSPPSRPGVTHVQGTANGYGERAGNADTFALIGNLVTKMGLPVVPAECLPELQRVSHAIAELANIAPDDHQPFVGASAFAHKAGLHASAIKVSPELYNHLDPAVVGNDMRILVTEMAGRASVELKGRELGVDLAGQADAIGRVVDQVKVLEADGWSFEAADASFELLLRAAAARRARPAVRAGELPDLGRALGQRRRGQRGDRQGASSTASGRSSAPPRATARSTRWTTRCARRWSAATRSWPRSRWPTTRCASWAGRAARARPPGC